MQIKSEKHAKAAHTRKVNTADAFVPDHLMQLPRHADMMPKQRPGLVSNGLVTMEMMLSLKWYHSVREIRASMVTRMDHVPSEGTIRFWLKVAVTMGLVNAYVQPLSKTYRMLYILDGQSVDSKYMPYMTIEEANERFVAKHGDGHEAKGWW